MKKNILKKGILLALTFFIVNKVFAVNLEELKLNITNASFYDNSAKKLFKNDTRLIVIGDIHGSYYNLNKILKVCLPKKLHNYFLENNENAPSSLPEDLHIAFLGDYINGEPGNIKVINTICKLKKENPDNVYLIKGNHDSKDDLITRKKGRKNGNKRITGTLLTEELEEKIIKENIKNADEELTNIVENYLTPLFNKMADKVDFIYANKRVFICHGNDQSSNYYVIPDSFKLLGEPNKYVKTVKIFLQSKKYPDLSIIGHDHATTGLSNKIISISRINEILEEYKTRELNLKDIRTSRRILWKIATENRLEKLEQGKKGVSSVNLSSMEQNPVILTSSGSFPSQITTVLTKGLTGNLPTFNEIIFEDEKLTCNIYGIDRENTIKKNIEDITLKYD